MAEVKRQSIKQNKATKKFVLNEVNKLKEEQSAALEVVIMRADTSEMQQK